MSVLEAGKNVATQMKASLDSGLDVVSDFQTIKFTLYARLVLPLDGYVFWVKADQLSQSALFNAIGLNQGALNQQTVTIPAKVLTAPGDLHYSSTESQNEESSFATNRVVFTSQVPVNDLNAVGPNTMYVGERDGLKFAFSSRGYYQENADTYHYVGDAVYPELATQLVENGRDLDTRNVIVSNSLPIWLAMNGYQQADWEAFGNPNLTLYPSFLLPENLTPPYAAVHISPASTRALAGAPLYGPTMSRSQLSTERVKITIFGQRNYNAQDFVDFVLQQSVNNADFGIMNSPLLMDEKRTQTELNVIAMKKTVEFEINYYQTRLRDIARQFILKAVPTYYVN